MVIIYNLCITLFSLVINTISCYETITRPRLFTSGQIMTYALGAMASMYVALTLHSLNVMQACQDFALREDLKWQYAAPALSRAETYAELAACILAIFLLLGAWLGLRWGLVGRESRAEQDSKPRRRPVIQRVLVVIILLLSLLLFGLIVVQMWQLFRERSGMDVVWNRTTGINQWSIGQIGAPLAWGPLITDMSYSLTEKLKRCSQTDDDESPNGKWIRMLRILRFWKNKSNPPIHKKLQDRLYAENVGKSIAERVRCNTW
jgi:hypothetical protein